MRADSKDEIYSLDGDAVKIPGDFSKIDSENGKINGKRTSRTSIGGQETDEKNEKDAKNRQTMVFVDVDAMKAKIREDAMKEEYDVSQFYHESGRAQWLAKHEVFDRITLSIITLNALWIAYDTDVNTADTLIDAMIQFQVAEHLFCIYFSFEWITRFCAFKYKRNCIRDPWFCFDSFLVSTMVLETWVMTIILLSMGGGSSLGETGILKLAKLMRLSRMARMARLLRAMPELLILIKGIGAATRSVIYTLCLLFVITYVFGIVFRQLLEDTEMGQEYFQTVLHSMHTLVRVGTLLDNLTPVVKGLERISVGYLGIWYLFVLLSALTVMNMLIGVLCEVVSAVAATEKETIMVSFVKGKLMDIMHDGGIDQDGDGEISKEEFSQILEVPEASIALREVGVDVIGLVDNLDFIFAPGPGDDPEEEKVLSFGDFMDLVLELRGSNAATVKDIVTLRKHIKTCADEVVEDFKHFVEKAKTPKPLLVPKVPKAERLTNLRKSMPEEASSQMLKDSELSASALKRSATVSLSTTRADRMNSKDSDSTAEPQPSSNGSSSTSSTASPPLGLTNGGLREAASDYGQTALSGVLKSPHKPAGTHYLPNVPTPNGNGLLSTEDKQLKTNLATQRSQLVRRLADLQMETHRFLDSLPAVDQATTLVLPKSGQSIEELVGRSRSASEFRRGPAPDSIRWSADQIGKARLSLRNMQTRLSTSLDALHRLRDIPQYSYQRS